MKQLHHEQFQALPDSQKGIVIIGLLLNAIVTVLLQTTLAVVLVRSARRSWLHRGQGTATAVRAAASPGLVLTAVAVAVHRWLARSAVDAVGSGQARNWLARIDQWIDDQQEREA